jgi:hypothetical protein
MNAVRFSLPAYNIYTGIRDRVLIVLRRAAEHEGDIIYFVSRVSRYVNPAPARLPRTTANLASQHLG